MLGHLVQLMVWKEKTSGIWAVQPRAPPRYSQGFLHGPPLHIVVKVLHILQPLPEDCCGVVNVVVSGCPGKARAKGAS